MTLGIAAKAEFFDHQLAARTVDDADAFLHRGQSGAVDNAVGLRREADVQGEVIGLGKELFSGNEADGVLARDGRRDKRIVAEEFHAEAARTARHFEADPPEAEDPELLAAQLAALQGLLLPLARVHGGIGAGNLACQRHHQAHGEFGHGDSVGAGRVHHHDAAAGRRFLNLNSRTNHQSIGVFQRRGQILHLIVREHVPPGLSLKNSQRGGRHFFCENDLHRFLSGGWTARARHEGRTGRLVNQAWTTSASRVRLAMPARSA
jgi:hypothetical protein